MKTEALFIAIALPSVLSYYLGFIGRYFWEADKSTANAWVIPTVFVPVIFAMVALVISVVSIVRILSIFL